MKTGTIYIANNGLEFHSPKNAAHEDYLHAIRQLLEQLQDDYKAATGNNVNFTMYETTATAFKAYMLNEKRNRQTLRRAWRRCMADVAKYQRESEA